MLVGLWQVEKKALWRSKHPDLDPFHLETFLAGPWANKMLSSNIFYCAQINRLGKMVTTQQAISWSEFVGPEFFNQHIILKTLFLLNLRYWQVCLGYSLNRFYWKSPQGIDLAFYKNLNDQIFHTHGHLYSNYYNICRKLVTHPLIILTIPFTIITPERFFCEMGNWKYLFRIWFSGGILIFIFCHFL